MAITASRQPNFAILVIGAWLLVMLQLVLLYWPETATTLNDTDDAMRLVELREFLGGHGWFDLHMARVQPPLGYDPHWSRLIDAGLAGTFLLFRQFCDAAAAERLMRVTWPMLWLLPAITGAAAVAWRLAGRTAALLVLLLALAGLSALQQFKPGRIDHHNVQIAIVMLTLAATVWSDRRPWCAAAGGGLTGLGLAIGFEGVPFLLACAAAFACRLMVSEAGARAARGYGIALAASTALAFLVSVAPGHWGRTECDSIALNSAAAAIVGGLGLALVSLARDARLRWAAALAVALAAVAVALTLEPRCVGGPYAMVDPAVRPIWLSHVSEMRPWLTMLMHDPATALGLAAFPAAAVVALAVLALRTPLRRDFAFQTASATLLLAAALMFVAIKAYCYAIWLGMPLIAVLVPHLANALRLSSLLPRFLLGLLLTPNVLAVGIISAADAAGLGPADHGKGPNVCFADASYAPLAKLPPGLVATAIDYGPFILALTPHTVLAAPYHRLGPGIIATHRIFAAPPEAAQRLVQDAHLDYVAICGTRGPSGLNDAQLSASLWDRLKAGDVPNWLAPVAAPAGQAFAIYRVRSR